MASRRSTRWGLGLLLVGFFALLFSPAFVSQVKADEVSDYGTVIGIVSHHVARLSKAQHSATSGDLVT
jgi:hypothetical protein